MELYIKNNLTGITTLFEDEEISLKGIEKTLLRHFLGSRYLDAKNRGRIISAINIVDPDDKGNYNLSYDGKDLGSFFISGGSYSGKMQLEVEDLQLKGGTK